MTAKEKIEALRVTLKRMAAVGLQDHVEGNLDEEVVIHTLAALGCAMGQTIKGFAMREAAKVEATVTE